MPRTLKPHGIWYIPNEKWHMKGLVRMQTFLYECVRICMFVCVNTYELKEGQQSLPPFTSFQSLIACTVLYVIYVHIWKVQWSGFVWCPLKVSWSTRLWRTSPTTASIHPPRTWSRSCRWVGGGLCGGCVHTHAYTIHARTHKEGNYI